MLRKYMLGLIAIMLVGASWRYRDSEMVRRLIDTPRQSKVVIKLDNDSSSRDQPDSRADSASERGARAAGGMRKCQKGKTISYTDDECPEGSQEKAMGGGAVTVVDGALTSGRSGSGNAAASRPTVLDMLDQPDNGDLAEKRMDRVINQ